MRSKPTVQLRKVFFRLLRKLNILSFLNLKTRRESKSGPLVIPLIGGIGLSLLEESEPWMEQFLRSLNIDSGSTFVDVGVNIGQTLLKVKTTNPKVRYLGIEPNPVCVNYVLELARLNSFQNVQIIPAGLGEKAMVAELHLSSEDQADSGATVLIDFRASGSLNLCPICLLSYDEIGSLLRAERVSVIKIDVEGAELDVVRTLLPLIESQRPLVILEILPTYEGRDRPRESRQKEVEEIFRSLAYKSFRVIKDNSGALLRLDPIDSFGSHSRIDWCDYVLVSKELGSL